MKVYEVPTDEAMRSILKNGNSEFPFEYYFDELIRFAGGKVELHWHREVEFSLVLGGTVVCRTDLYAYELKRGDMLFINSETMHRFESADGGTMVNMVFAPEFIASPTSLIYERYVEPVLSSEHELICFDKRLKENDDIVAAAARLYAAATAECKTREIAIHTVACELWTRLFERIGESTGQKRGRSDKLMRARMQKMLQFIHMNYPAKIRLADIAAAANISASEALRCFRTEKQTSPVSYLNDYRLECAKILLLSTTDTVTSVSIACGFESPGYFCRLFTIRYGCSPSAFRKK